MFHPRIERLLRAPERFASARKRHVWLSRCAGLAGQETLELLTAQPTCGERDELLGRKVPPLAQRPPRRMPQGGTQIFPVDDRAQGATFADDSGKDFRIRRGSKQTRPVGKGEDGFM